jgi:hypothetical protein
VAIGGIQKERITRSADATTATFALTSNAGAPAGALVLRYANRTHAAIVAALTVRLALAALLATCATTAVFAWALRRLLQRRDRLLHQAADALGANRPPAGIDPHVADLVDKVNQTAATALVEVTAARHALSPHEAAG